VLVVVETKPFGGKSPVTWNRPIDPPEATDSDAKAGLTVTGRRLAPTIRQDLWIGLIGAAAGGLLIFFAGDRPKLAVIMLGAVITGAGFVLARRSLLLELAVLIMIGGILQAVATTISPVRASLLLDDLPFALLMIALLPEVLRGSMRLKVLSAATILLTAVAVVRSPDLSVGVLQARQVLIPPLLILAGYLLAHRDWRRFHAATIALACFAAAYCAVELLGWMPIDPTPSLAANDNANIYVHDGLPGYYYYFGLSDEPYVRAGGPLLNPPSTGLFLGTATVIAFWILRGRWRWVCTVALLLATLSTISRAGVLIAVVGLGGPYLVRRVRIGFALPIAAGIALLAGFLLSQHAGSAAHLDGLVDGLKRALLQPWGQGFGHNGNIAFDAGLPTNGKESLLGVALAAIGLPVLLATGWLAYRIVARLHSTPPDLVWRVMICGAALAVAATAETASGLDASVPLWMVAGVGLTLASASAAKNTARTNAVA
jgi:hypothetical protein